ncbi:MAG: Signal peptide peptidase [Methanomassiliicoccales archaeon PtaU1.Bin030]|nr:MAG: Signal peptide peptidase [Methanomassiliicoccales archaeon PtaU1.Bin030]
MRKDLPLLAMAAIYLFVQTGAIFLAPLFMPEFSAFPEPNDPINPFIYIFLVLVMTGIILILIKYGRKRIVQSIFYVSIFITMLYVFIPLFLLADQEGTLALLASLALAGGLMYLLVKRGEWYVIDGVGLIIAVGVTAILGMSLGILPVIILLIIMAVYDAISVYKTKHMITLAEGVSTMRLPVLFIVPQKEGFSMDNVVKKGSILPKNDEPRDAFYMGLGDTVIPGLLAVSASLYLPQSASLLMTANLWAAAGAMIGGLLGYLVLFRYVLRGRPQAGLPFLDTGAIAGYLIAYALAYGEIGLGMLGLS